MIQQQRNNTEQQEHVMTIITPKLYSKYFVAHIFGFFRATTYHLLTVCVPLLPINQMTVPVLD